MDPEDFGKEASSQDMLRQRASNGMRPGWLMGAEAATSAGATAPSVPPHDPRPWPPTHRAGSRHTGMAVLGRMSATVDVHLLDTLKTLLQAPQGFQPAEWAASFVASCRPSGAVRAAPSSLARTVHAAAGTGQRRQPAGPDAFRNCRRRRPARARNPPLVVTQRMQVGQF